MCEYNLSKICLLCLNDKENLKNVYNEDEDNILIIDKIEFLISSELLLLDQNSPESICCTCHEKLNSFCIYKQMCLENNRRLRYFINKNDNDFLLQQKEETIIIEDSDDNFNQNVLMPGSKPEEKEKPIKEQLLEDKFLDEELLEKKLLDEEQLEEEDMPDNIRQEISDFINEHVSNIEKPTEEELLEDKLLNEELLEENFLDEELLLHEEQLEKELLEEEDMLDTISQEISDFINEQESNIDIKEEEIDSHIEEHIKKEIHEIRQRLPCMKCDKSYKYKHHLNRHIREVHKEGIYKCNICNQIFKFKSCFNLHMKKFAHFFCAECKINFSAEKDYRIHVVKLHRSSNGKFLKRGL